jgi:hypothetical protein
MIYGPPQESRSCLIMGNGWNRLITPVENFDLLESNGIVARLLIAASRTRLSLVSGWGCRGRRLSRG